MSMSPLVASYGTASTTIVATPASLEAASVIERTFSVVTVTVSPLWLELTITSANGSIADRTVTNDRFATTHGAGDRQVKSSGKGSTKVPSIVAIIGSQSTQSAPSSRSMSHQCRAPGSS